MKNVLVSGADGFVGRNLVNRLLRDGKEVYAVVYPGNNIYTEYHDIKLHVISLDLNQVLDHLNSFPENIDVFYHLAWVGVKPEFRNNLDIQLTNISMTMNCMKLASAKRISKIVLPGSTNEYLYSGKLINKETIPTPNNAYGAAKAAVRFLCNSYAAANDIKFVYAIVTGIYAADRRDDNVIFYTIDKLLKKEKPALTKLEQLWDYVYIDDVVEAFTAIGEKGKNGAVYAIGHGDNWALSNYIRIIHHKIDPSLPLGIGEIPYTGKTL